MIAPPNTIKIPSTNHLHVFNKTHRAYKIESNLLQQMSTCFCYMMQIVLLQLLLLPLSSQTNHPILRTCAYWKILKRKCLASENNHMLWLQATTNSIHTTT